MPKAQMLATAESCMLMPVDALLGTIDRCPVLPPWLLKQLITCILHGPVSWRTLVHLLCWHASKGETQGLLRASADTPWVPPRLFGSHQLCACCPTFFYFAAPAFLFLRALPCCETVLLTSMAAELPQACSQYSKGRLLYELPMNFSMLAPWVCSTKGQFNLQYARAPSSTEVHLHLVVTTSDRTPFSALLPFLCLISTPLPTFLAITSVFCKRRLY